MIKSIPAPPSSSNSSINENGGGHRRRRRQRQPPVSEEERTYNTDDDDNNYDDDDDNKTVSTFSGSERQQQQQDTVKTTSRRRKRKKPITKPTGVSNHHKGSIIWTILTLGLMCSLATNVYIAGYLERQKKIGAEDHPKNNFHNDDEFKPKEDDGTDLKQYDVHKLLRRNKAKANNNNDNNNNNNNNRNLDEPEHHENLLEGKERIVALITAAGIDLDPKEDEELIRDLPLWSDVVSLYGDKPIIHGLDRCEHFQTHSDRADHFVSTAGTFNSGTNLMAELLIANCRMQDRMNKYGKTNRGVRWQVPWGKHTPPGDEEYRKNHKTYTDTYIAANDILPAVTVRDPLFWLKSMCKHRYTARWYRTDEHCPNFSDLQDLTETQTYGLLGNTVELKGYGAAVKYADFIRRHDSIVGLWNDWYNEYLNADFDYLMVRFEDLLFHPEEVTKAVCECAGGSMNKNGHFIYVVDSAKKGKGAHGKKRTGYVDALVKYGTEIKRYNGYQNKQDLEFIKENLDQNLMELMKYPTVDPDFL